MYTKLGIVPALIIHRNATHDLRVLMVQEREMASKILALLEQIKADPDYLGTLLSHDFGAEHQGSYHVSKFFEFWKKGYDLWRLKVWDQPRGSLPYRIVYAYDIRQRQYHVLAIVHRTFDYQSDHAITKRILSDYRDLGFKIH